MLLLIEYWYWFSMLKLGCCDRLIVMYSCKVSQHAYQGYLETRAVGKDAASLNAIEPMGSAEF